MKYLRFVLSAAVADARQLSINHERRTFTRRDADIGLGVAMNASSLAASLYEHISA